MSPFITFRDRDANGELQYYILQREFPHFVGILVSQPVEHSLAQSPISGHYLWVAFAGTLRGNIIPGYQDIQNEIESVFQNMAAWYYTNRIEPDLKKYRKWKIQSNDTKPVQ